MPQGRFQTDSMLCSSCDENRPTKSLRLNLSKYKIEGVDGEIERVDCKFCGNFIALKASTVNGVEDIIIKINEADKVGDDNEEKMRKNCWQQAKTVNERIIYYALSQIVYPERDTPDPKKYESIYDLADETDLVMLRWECGLPIGFYTLKLKGSKILPTNEEYAMPILDTAYIRSEYRNRGMGIEILTNITEMFPNENIGFSRPISEGMWKVLDKFLTIHKNIRLKFWEIENAGDEGSRKLIWFTLKKIKNNNNNNNNNNNKSHQHYV